jgi:hypothetical protein
MHSTRSSRSHTSTWLGIAGSVVCRSLGEKTFSEEESPPVVSLECSIRDYERFASQAPDGKETGNTGSASLR